MKRVLYLYSFVSETNELYFLNDEEEVVKCDKNQLLIVLSSLKNKQISINLNTIFEPKNILVSPLNSPIEFLKGNYILTDLQENIKERIMNNLAIKQDVLFFGLTGGPGTGKTLLLYDIAKELSKTYKILIFHCGYLCKGHETLNCEMENVRIAEARALRYKEIRNADIVFVDESHRIYPTQLDKIERWAIRSKTACLFSFDESQRLSHFEYRSNSYESIVKICGDNIEKLTNKIRTNQEISTFISKLRNQNKHKEEKTFPNVKIIYEPNKEKGVILAKEMEKCGYTYISFTNSSYNARLDYQKSNRDTHDVIGQEFDKVVMTFPNDFYFHNGMLNAKTHPNPNYMLDQLLYQGLTRARTGIALIVEGEDNLSIILSMFA